MTCRRIRDMGWRLLLLALVVLGTAAMPVHAAPGEQFDRTAVQVPLVPCIKPVAAGDRAADLLMRPDWFDCTRAQGDFGPGDFWVRLAVPAGTPASATMLRWTSQWQAGAVVVAAYADGSRQQFAVPITDSGRFVHVGGFYTLALRERGAPATLLFQISGSGNMRGILVNPHLASREHITSIDTGRAAIYGGFAGLCLALFVYNLMIWRAMRQPYLLAYCAMVAACLTYGFTSSATLAQWVPQIDNNLRLRFNYAGLAATALFAMWFTRSFLGDALFSRRFDRLLVGSGAFVAVATLGFVVFADWHPFWLDRLYFIAFAVFFAVGTSIFVRAWQRGGKLERLFVATWALPLLLNSLRMLHGFGPIGHNFWLDNATLLAMSAEALLSSMLIAWRIRLVQEDRDHARAQEAVALALADTDDLTCLLNRRALMRAACPGREVVGQYRLVLIDIDHFKAINDSVGHSAGDAVLQKIADIIRATVRPDVVAARIGGEEFALLFPTGNTDRRYYNVLLARIRALPPVGGQRVTISMGAANGWLGGSEGEWLALYRIADAALYEAKGAGRNRLIVAPRYRILTDAA